MLKEYIQNEIKQTIKSIPHMQTPSNVLAQVTRVDADTCCIKILNQDMTVDSTYSEIPYVDCHNHDVKNGDIVAVAVLYGNISSIYMLGVWQYG